MQAALAAVKALVEKLGNFISPYLSSLLTLLLRQRLIARRCRSQEVAESIRSSLASAIPSRLLLPVLLKQLPSTVQVRLLLICSSDHNQRGLLFRGFHQDRCSSLEKVKFYTFCLATCFLMPLFAYLKTAPKPDTSSLQAGCQCSGQQADEARHTLNLEVVLCRRVACQWWSCCS